MAKTVEAAQDVAIIDFAPALYGGPDDLKRVAATVVSACEDIGFFYIANHPIPDDLRRRVFEEAANFFALPDERKMQVSMERSLNYRGYIPLNVLPKPENRRGAGVEGFQQHLDDDATADSEAKELEPDASESFQIHRELALDDPDVQAGKPLHGPNQWPAGLPLMRDTMLEYFDAMSAFAKRVLEVFAVGLDLDPRLFGPYYVKSLMQVRLIHYPAQAPGENVPVGVRPHSDAGALTLLMQDDVGGLEVRNKQGEWVLVPPIEDTYVVNIGDTMKLWTNNRFQSTPHRVINTYGADRYSIPFFANPDYDAVIKPIPTCVDDENPPVFDTLHCGESMLHTYSRIWPSAPVEA
ncbi:MAG: 2-oxoglutarate and iron-dependent oxygenase domain-containing protein [Alphaproteobacteria bacterium]